VQLCAPNAVVVGLFISRECWGWLLPMQKEKGGHTLGMTYMHTDIAGEVHSVHISTQDEFNMSCTGILSKLCAPGA